MTLNQIEVCPSCHSLLMERPALSCTSCGATFDASGTIVSMNIAATRSSFGLNQQQTFATGPASATKGPSVKVGALGVSILFVLLVGIAVLVGRYQGSELQVSSPAVESHPAPLHMEELVESTIPPRAALDSASIPVEVARKVLMPVEAAQVAQTPRGLDATSEANEQINRALALAGGATNQGSFTVNAERIRPSFDCAKASLDAERMVCGSTPLARLDQSMALAYQAALRKTGTAEDLRDSQLAWLRARRNICVDELCLMDVYTRRLEQLQETR